MTALVRFARAALSLCLAVGAAPALSQSSPAPWTTAHRYDAAGRETGTISPDPDGAGPLTYPAVRNNYDGAGQLTGIEYGEMYTWQSEAVAPGAWPDFVRHRWVQIGYDGVGHKISERVFTANNVAEALTQWSYDNAGRLECTAVRMNPAAFASPPASACTQGPAGSHGPDRIERNVYDAAGQLLQTKDGVGTPLERTEASWEYGPDGEKTALTDARGYRAEMTYDGHGRQAKWIFPSKTATGVADASDYEAYFYDPAGNRTALRKRDGTNLFFTYDALNRMTVKSVGVSVSGANGYTVAYGYDLRGLQTAAKFNTLAGQGVSNAFDGFGRLVSSTTDLGGVARTIVSAYDAEGRRIRVAHNGAAFVYGEDGLGRLSTVAVEGGAQLAAFTYNAKGENASLVRPGSASYYEHDGIGRLSGASHDFAATASDVAWTYSWNPASQLRQETRSNPLYGWKGAQAINRNYQVNGQNQYTATVSSPTQSAAFAYDANGNLTSDGATSYMYDAESKLVSATGATAATLLYDPLGRLWQTSNTTTTQFLYDGDELVAEYDGAGTLLRRYVHGAAVDDPLVWYEGAGLAQPRSLHADRQGSIVAVADGAGALIAANSYDEYGIPAATNPGRFAPRALQKRACDPMWRAADVACDGI